MAFSQIPLKSARFLTKFIQNSPRLPVHPTVGVLKGPSSFLHSIASSSTAVVPHSATYFSALAWPTARMIDFQSSHSEDEDDEFPDGSAGYGWNSWEDEKTFHLNVEMPGLSKEEIKVYVKKDKLIIKGESSDKNDASGYYSRSEMFVPPGIDFLKLDEIKAQTKNGVLSVVTPMLKAEEDKDLIVVSVED